MAQTAEGALKNASVRIGVSIDEYIARQSAGEKWCYHCRQWHLLSSFGRNKRKPDGLESVCLQGRKEIYAKSYKPIPPTLSKRGQRPHSPCRDGDRKQARQKVNYAVKKGQIPHPNSLSCTDCGHRWNPGERRHEYDHFKGYGHDSHLTVEPVCTQCHKERSEARGETHGKNKY